MTQNINLLNNLTLHTKSAFNAKLITKIFVGWILLLAMIYILALSINSSRQNELLQLKATQKNLTAKINGYNKMLVPFKETTPTDATKIPSGSTNLIGFYGYLEDLANFTPHGVWLKNITFSEPEDTIIINGSAIVASSVSTLISSLSKASFFKDKSLGALQLHENLKTNDTDFTISSNPINQDQDKEE